MALPIAIKRRIGPHRIDPAALRTELERLPICK
jgi:hypothetical protein